MAKGDIYEKCLQFNQRIYIKVWTYGAKSVIIEYRGNLMNILLLMMNILLLIYKGAIYGFTK